jgi:type II secretory pathway pseudopilin PulG
MSARTGNARAGFSALEALIAAAILGLALAPLLDLQRQSVRAAARYDAAREALSLQRSALDVLTSVNPMIEPSGRRVLTDQLSFEWVASPLTRTTPSVGYLRPEGGFDVALFRLNVRIFRNRTLATTFSTEQIGWRKTDQ